MIFILQPFFRKAVRNAHNNLVVFYGDYVGVFKPCCKVRLACGKLQLPQDRLPQLFVCHNDKNYELFFCLSALGGKGWKWFIVAKKYYGVLMKVRRKYRNSFEAR